ncbi:MAG: AAA family ATPase [Alphaproteobacteria bacterium]|nr:AAA family ATPase [Alphaproteobacteria bacterium]MBN2780197.1 AAA family ATPase [Alphaproteobacteria bacterium]
MPKRRICIVGSHSTGKTTLAKALSTRLKIPFPDKDSVKNFTKKNIQKTKHFDQLSKDETWEVQTDFLEEIIKLTEKKTAFVSDFSGFTWESYNDYFLGKDYLNKIPDYKTYQEKCRESLKCFDYIFYLPPEIPLIPNGFRPTSNKIRLEIDKLIQNYLKRTKTKYITLKGSVEDRVQQAQDIIQTQQKKNIPQNHEHPALSVL